MEKLDAYDLKASREEFIKILERQGVYNLYHDFIRLKSTGKILGRILNSYFIDKKDNVWDSPEERRAHSKLREIVKEFIPSQSLNLGL